MPPDEPNETIVNHPDALTDNTELEDVDERVRFDLSLVDARLLRSPVVVRAVAGIAAASMVLAWPGRTDRVLARLIGLAILALAVTGLWASLRQRPRRLIDLASGLVGLAAAGALLLSPNQSEVALARLVAIGIGIVALRDLARLRTDHRPKIDGDSTAWIVSRSLALLGIAALLLSFPAEVFAAVTTIAALGWIGLSLLVIVASLDARTSGTTNYAASLQLVAAWLAERHKSVDDRQALYSKLLYEGPAAARRAVRFFTLMTFAAVIASMGVITDSTAVVIGAMLIAPLMTPLMGMAISLVMGWPRRLGQSALIAAAGILLAIAVGAVLGLVSPGVIDTASNSQVIARSSPTILDLITALAAGAAGAYGLSRPDVSDSLPGVAIAISLVPPLSVVGIAYSQGDWNAGNGSLLLFATNMLAILIMGGLTFIATGVTPLARVTENQRRVRTAVAAVGGVGALVIGALFLNGAQIAEDLFDRSTTEDTVEEWLDDHPAHSLVRVNLDGEVITATIVGPSAGAPTASSLADRLSERLDRPVTADLRLIIEERDRASGPAGREPGPGPGGGGGRGCRRWPQRETRTSSVAMTAARTLARRRAGTGIGGTLRCGSVAIDHRHRRRTDDRAAAVDDRNAEGPSGPGDLRRSQGADAELHADAVAEPVPHRGLDERGAGHLRGQRGRGGVSAAGGLRDPGRAQARLRGP